MTSRSARVASERPFYALYAEAYDALITEPVEPWIEAVQAALLQAGFARARVLDAGCGTGRSAEALLAHGHRVSLLDASAQLLEIARRRCPGVPVFREDITQISSDESFDAVICRGVLNDLNSDRERDGAMSSFARVLRDNGILILDVRDSGESKSRADGNPRRTEVDLSSGDHLIFTSTPAWRGGHISVDERYELISTDGSQSIHDYNLRMRPWSVEELGNRLLLAGFDRIEIASGVGRRTLDRLFVVARLAERTAR